MPPRYPKVTASKSPLVKWNVATSDPKQTAALAKALGIAPVAARVLAARGYGDPERAKKFLRPQLDQLHDPALLTAQLDCLIPLHGRAVIEAWNGMARAGRWDELTETLLVQHYDPAYTRAIRKHYPTLDQAPVVTAVDCTAGTYEALARQLINTASPAPPSL